MIDINIVNVLLMIIALFVFLDWYEHSKELSKVKAKYSKIWQDTTSSLKKLLGV